MGKVKLGKFRLLVTFVLTLFGRKPSRVSFEAEWENLPYSFHADYLTESGGDAILRTGKRVKSLPPE